MNRLFTADAGTTYHTSIGAMYTTTTSNPLALFNCFGWMSAQYRFTTSFPLALSLSHLEDLMS